MPPRAAWTVRSARPASATISHSFGRERRGARQQRHRGEHEHHVQPVTRAERRPQADGLAGGLVVQHAEHVRRRVPERRVGAQRQRGGDRHRDALDRPLPPALEHEIRARDRRAREHGAVQIAPQGEQRDEQPDALATAPAPPSAAAARRPRTAGARRAGRGSRRAGRSRPARAAATRSRARARARPPRRASRTSSASVPATAATCATCTPAAAERREQREDQLAEHRDVRPAARSRPSHRGSPSGIPPRSAIARPSSASHGPSAASTLSSAANAVTASAASPPGLCQGAQRVASPRECAHGSQPSGGRSSPFGRGPPRRRFVVLEAPPRNL